MSAWSIWVMAARKPEALVDRVEMAPKLLPAATKPMAIDPLLVAEFADDPPERPQLPRPSGEMTLPMPRPGETMFCWSCRASEELKTAGVPYPRASRMIMSFDFQYLPADDAFDEWREQAGPA